MERRLLVSSSGLPPHFEDLRNGAAEIVAQNPDARWTLREAWDPFGFLNLCEMAGSEKDGASDRVAIAVQSLEWRLLFEWCAAQTAA